MKEYVKRLWNTLKTTFLNVKLQRLCKSHHLQCITSSKLSLKLDKCLCVRDKSEDLCWMYKKYFQKPLSVNTICLAICRCQLKLYHVKRKPYVNMVQKCRRVLWAKAHFKLTVSKLKSVLWSDETLNSQFCPLG